jgi:hypothetical protein
MRNFLYLKSCLVLGIGLQLALFAAETTTVPGATQTTQNQPAETEMVAEMKAWMKESAPAALDYVNMLDRGEYAQSWSKGDPVFQQVLSQDEWVKSLNGARKPLGKVTSRKLKDQRPAVNPKGLPIGAYMVVEYDTAFENAPVSGELLTLHRGTDGKWRVLTYQVN